MATSVEIIPFSIYVTLCSLIILGRLFSILFYTDSREGGGAKRKKNNVYDKLVC